MEISDRELREMVREAVVRRTGQAPLPVAVAPVQQHASHGLLTLVAGGAPDGSCLIEPAVQCTHCGYCCSMGH